MRPQTNTQRRRHRYFNLLLPLVMFTLLALACSLGGNPPNTTVTTTSGTAATQVVLSDVPEVEIKSPADNSEVVINTEVQVYVHATDRQGVTRIEMRVDNLIVDTVASQDPNGTPTMDSLLSWTPNSAGPHVVQVVAFRGNTQGNPKNITLIVRESAAQVTLPAGSPSLLTASPTNDPTCRIRASVDGLNVRTGPGVNYDRITSLGLGTIAPVIGTNADQSWWEIDSQGTIGWVSAPYVTTLGICGTILVVPIPPSPTVPAGAPTFVIPPTFTPFPTPAIPPTNTVQVVVLPSIAFLATATPLPHTASAADMSSTAIFATQTQLAKPPATNTLPPTATAGPSLVPTLGPTATPSQTPTSTPTPLLPNLTITGITPNPPPPVILPSAQQAATIPFTVTVANNGSAPAAVFQVTASLSNGTSDSTSSNVILNPGQTADITVNVTFTSDLQGQQLVKFIADSTNVIVESNENDNTSNVTVNVALATVQNATASFTPTASNTPTYTPTSTPTVIVTVPVTLVPTSTVLPSNTVAATTAAPSATIPPTNTAQATATASLTLVGTTAPTNTATLTLVATIASSTPTDTATAAPTLVPTHTPTTASTSVTSTATDTFTPTATVQVSLTSTATTAAATNTATHTPTTAASATTAPTIVPTATATTAPSATLAPATATHTPTTAPTATTPPTNTPAPATATATTPPTATHTPTTAPTATTPPTNTPVPATATTPPTATHTPTTAPTATIPPTATHTPTVAPTATHTPTVAPTATIPPTATHTPTVAATATTPSVDLLTVPVAPDFSDPNVSTNVKGIYATDKGKGVNAADFVIVGDNTLYGVDEMQTATLKLDSYQQSLGTAATYFQPGFAGATRATRGAYGSTEILNTPVAGCQNQTPINCAIATHAATMFIEVGTVDAANNVLIATFTQNLTTAVNTAKTNGVIPILVTIADIPPGQDAKIATYNQAIYSVANTEHVPLFNLYGLRKDTSLFDANGNLSDSGQGKRADFSTANLKFGVNQSNLNLLQTLNNLKNAVPLQ